MPSPKLPSRTGNDTLPSDFGPLFEAGKMTRMRRFAIRAGPTRFAAMVGIGAMLVSVSATAFLEWLLGFPAYQFWGGIVIGFAMPLIIATPIAAVFAKLMIDVDNARRSAERLAAIDPLTGAYNRRRFFLLAETEFNRAGRLVSRSRSC